MKDLSPVVLSPIKSNKSFRDELILRLNLDPLNLETKEDSW